MVVQGLLQGRAQRLGHSRVRRVRQHHVEDLFVVHAAKGSEENHHRDVLSNLGDGRIYLTAFFCLRDVHLELQWRLVALFVLGADLGVPRVLGVQLHVEDEDDVAGLSLLGDDYLL